MKNAPHERYPRRTLVLLAVVLALGFVALPGASLACDNNTWPYISGIEMYHGWTFSMVNLTPFNLKILPANGTAFNSFPYNTVIPPANTKKKADGGTSATVGLTTWDSKNDHDYADACGAHIDFQIGDGSTYNFGVYFMQDPNQIKVGTLDYVHARYAKLAPISQTAGWKYIMDNGMHAGYYATKSATGGEAILVAVSNDNKYVVSLYKTDKDKHDLTLVVTYLDPTAGYTNKNRKLYWLING